MSVEGDQSESSSSGDDDSDQTQCPQIFFNQTAWFSGSVTDERVEKWKAYGGEICDFETAQFVFSEDPEYEDTKRLYDSQAYLYEHLAIFHAAYIDECVENESCKHVAVGDYFLPPKELHEIISQQMTFKWAKAQQSKKKLTPQKKQNSTVVLAAVTPPKSSGKNKAANQMSADTQTALHPPRNNVGRSEKTGSSDKNSSGKELEKNEEEISTLTPYTRKRNSPRQKSTSAVKSNKIDSLRLKASTLQSVSAFVANKPCDRENLSASTRKSRTSSTCISNKEDALHAPALQPPKRLSTRITRSLSPDNAVSSPPKKNKNRGESETKSTRHGNFNSTNKRSETDKESLASGKNQQSHHSTRAPRSQSLKRLGAPQTHVNKVPKKKLYCDYMPIEDFPDINVELEDFVPGQDGCDVISLQ